MDEMVTKESIQKAYRRYAQYYDLAFGAIFHPGRKTAIEKLKCRPGERILEVGVGTGLSLNLYPENVHVTGIDLSADMLKKALQRVENQNLKQVEALVQMDALEMSFPDNHFDKVVAMYVASVVPDVGRLAHEIRRVCRPEGTIIFLNHFENKNLWVRKIESWVQPLAKFLGFHPEFPMEEFLQKTQFQVEQTIPVNLLNYWTVLIGTNNKIRH
jgi:phosphatidylethanolamine/phosphatidyl-N-methylethanolamine N-methyltransferase